MISYLFVVIICNSEGCKFTNANQLVSKTMCEEMMQVYLKVPVPPGIKYTAGACLPVKEGVTI